MTLLKYSLAADDNIIGDIPLPGPLAKYGSYNEGLVNFLNNLIQFLIVIAGLYAFVNLILAGYGFMSAGGDPKNVEKAWAKIWQSLVGLLIIAGSFVLAAIFGWLLFGDASAILSPKIYGPE
jgi:hypothetical protein